MVTVHTGAETIQGSKLFKGGNYSRKYGIHVAQKYAKQSQIKVVTFILNQSLGSKANPPKKQCKNHVARFLSKIKRSQKNANDNKNKN